MQSYRWETTIKNKLSQLQDLMLDWEMQKKREKKKTERKSN